MDLMKSIAVSSSGMAAQSMRMQMISENIANADSISTPEGGPYRRKLITFETEMGKHGGLQGVKVSKITRDHVTPLKMVYDPSHELANEKGFVPHPNISTFLETVDMKDATRKYEANMAAIESAKQMMVRSLDLLR